MDEDDADDDDDDDEDDDDDDDSMFEGWAFQVAWPASTWCTWVHPFTALVAWALPEILLSLFVLKSAQRNMGSTPLKQVQDDASHG